MTPDLQFKDRPPMARYAIIAFAIIGLGALAYSAMNPVVFPPASHVLLLFAAAVVTSQPKVRLYKRSTLSLLTVVVLVAVIREGLAVSVLAAMCGVAAQTYLPDRKLVLHRLVFNMGMIAGTVVTTWWVYCGLAAANPVGPLSPQVTATILAAFTYFLGNTISVSLIIALSQDASIVQIWLKHFLGSAPAYLMAGLLALVAIASVDSGSVVTILALIAVTSISYFSSVRAAAERL